MWPPLRMNLATPAAAIARAELEKYPELRSYRTLRSRAGM